MTAVHYEIQLTEGRQVVAPIPANCTLSTAPYSCLNSENNSSKHVPAPCTNKNDHRRDFYNKPPCFLVLPQVGRLLDVKREDVKAKRATEVASGVALRRKRAAEAAKKRRRSQVEKALVLKKADELLEESGKAEDIRQRRGSLGTLRPEDVSRGKTGGPTNKRAGRGQRRDSIAHRVLRGGRGVNRTIGSPLRPVW